MMLNNILTPIKEAISKIIDAIFSQDMAKWIKMKLKMMLKSDNKDEKS